MKKSIFGVVSALFSVYMLTACVSCNEAAEKAVPTLGKPVPTFANPIYTITPGTDSTRVGESDPWVYKHSDGYYYYCASYGNTFDQIRIRRAKSIDLLDSNDESEVVSIITSTNGGVNTSGVCNGAFSKIRSYLWAPELHYIDGSWYLFFTANCNDDADPANTNGPWGV